MKNKPKIYHTHTTPMLKTKQIKFLKSPPELGPSVTNFHNHIPKIIHQSQKTEKSKLYFPTHQPFFTLVHYKKKNTLEFNFSKAKF